LLPVVGNAFRLSNMLPSIRSKLRPPHSGSELPRSTAALTQSPADTGSRSQKVSPALPNDKSARSLPAAAT